MLAKKVFILTRPNSNKILSDRLSDIGFESLSLPSLKIVSLDLQNVPLPEIYDFIFFSSSNAVKFYLIQLNKIYGPIKTWPTKTVIVTVGSATADSFRSCNFINMDLLTILSPDSSAAQLDSESLWKVLRNQSLYGKRFLFVRGTTGRDWLINKVSKYCEVDICSVYSRDNIEWSYNDSEQLKSISVGSTSTVIWLFTSTESVEATIRNITILNLSNWFNSCKFIVTHRRIYNFLSDYFLKRRVSEIFIKECLPYNESIISACKDI
ncbi:uroporphyrinogen-III synthase [Candidatus Kinetoplastidibacterium galati]|uniref:Uroporphyrinogen-III synthase hemD n=2 Tax=Candidatus Kinetoplastidibacterium galati TaxID=994695 RepID=M1LXX5_9PROT|nr:uroporphyrinogen-III synthase [Candidatus Kinetoplastibacterium galatii]AEM25269.1 uroporphyrinogen III synthase [Candidatus Kinetoplastibacterium galatii]AGF48921.1 uroporphyrinogen-III synthase hemD [Candidatus Kinetoplastibacterium galatii TCC219]